MIQKKISRLLFIPALGLSLNTSLASAHETHVTEMPTPPSPYLDKSTIRNMVVPGKMIDSNTIQVNTADLAKLPQSDAMRIITVTDEHGIKQRFVLLTPMRSQLAAELMKYGGSLKEYQLYPVVDEDGNRLSLLASKRIATAPADQLTVVFASSEAAAHFFAATQEALMTESIMFANSQIQEVTNTEYTNEINEINKSVEMHGQDQQKSSIVESIDAFPTRAVLIHQAAPYIPSSDTAAQ